jgi:hypothetical protein
MKRLLLAPLLLAMAIPVNANSLFKVKDTCAKVFFEISPKEAFKRLGLTKNNYEGIQFYTDESARIVFYCKNFIPDYKYPF